MKPPCLTTGIMQATLEVPLSQCERLLRVLEHVMLRDRGAGLERGWRGAVRSVSRRWGSCP